MKFTANLIVAALFGIVYAITAIYDALCFVLSASWHGVAGLVVAFFGSRRQLRSMGIKRV